MNLLVGRHFDIAAGDTDLPLETVRKYRRIWEGQGFTLPPEPTVVAKKPRPAKAREPVGTALKTRIEKLITIKTGKSCGCSNLATLMDGWGIAGCEKRRTEILNHLVGNREILEEALRQSGGWITTLIAPVVAITPAAVLREGALWLLNQAIEDVRRMPPPAPRVKPPRQQAEVITRHGDAWTQRGGRLKPTPGQDRNYQACMAAPPPTPDPFTGPPVFHFGGHLWPIKNNWQRHADAWNRLAETITGQLVVGVGLDDTTDSVETVRARLHPRIELFFEPNTPHGENPTFERLRHMMPRGQNDIFLYAHGKGVRQRTFDSKAIDFWVDLMYRGVIFQHSLIMRQMAEGYKMVGACRMFGLSKTTDLKHWHYAGTFWALRSKYFPGCAVPHRYGGVEVWPGQMFSANEVHCTFLDNVAMRALYLDAYMEKLKPTFEEWIKHNAPSGL